MIVCKIDFNKTFPFREKIEEMSRLRDELTTKGFNLPPEKEKGEHFDSNCITPVRLLFFCQRHIPRDLY